MEDLSVISKALADPMRVRILELLGKHNFCVNALSSRLKITQPAVSQHLKILKQANLVVPWKKGYFVHYQLNSEMADQYLKGIQTLFHPKGGECKCRKKPESASIRKG